MKRSMFGLIPRLRPGQEFSAGVDPQGAGIVVRRDAPRYPTFHAAGHSAIRIAGLSADWSVLYQSVEGAIFMKLDLS